MSDEADIRVRLAEILGEIKLTNQKLDTLTGNVSDLKLDHSDLAARVTALETARSEQRGVITAARVLWGIGGGGVIALGAVIARALGA